MVQYSDTLVCDTLRVAHWQHMPGYDYNRELLVPEVSLWQLLNKWLYNLLGKLFGIRFADTYGEWLLIFLFILIVGLVVWFLYRKRPELFMRSRKAPLSYAVHEDTIYGVDFEAEIACALDREDYKEAVRLLYLQTLKFLSDRELLLWEPHKTPTEYTYEIRSGEEVRSSLYRLTHVFLRVRYGNFEATQALYEQLCCWQEEIEKGCDR